jgi:hypothetical protein
VTEDQDPGYGLVMPFVNVTSKGGPAQADLVAMKHGYRAEWVPSEVDGWTYVKFIRQAVD